MPVLLLTVISPELFLLGKRARFVCSLKLPCLTLQSGEQLSNIKEHTKQINDIQTSRDMTMFITASKDNTAKVRPPAGNAAVCWYLLVASPLRDYLGGLLLGNLSGCKVKAGWETSVGTGRHRHIKLAATPK